MYDELKIKTGKIIVQESSDEEYPGVWMEFMKDEEAKSCQSRPAVKMEYNPSTRQVRILVWADPDCEDYTDEYTLDAYYKKK